MERERLSKKQVISLAIGVLTMIILVSSATYAYFRVSIGNTATSTTITGDIGGGTLGTVTLSGGGTELYLGISAYDMSQSKVGTTYYSSSTEGSRETSLTNAGKTTYTATLSGDNEGKMMYACDYEFTVTASGEMLGKSNGAQLIFEGDINQTLSFSSTSLAPKKVTGTFRKITSSNSTREFNAYLQLENKNTNQNSLAGTNLSVEIENTKWNCYLLDDSDLVGEAYAILTETGTIDYYILGNVQKYDLTFVRSETPIEVGSTYNGKKVDIVYTGFEDTTNVPWDTHDVIDNITIEDKIKPISLNNWFSISGFRYDESDPIEIDLTKIDTSLVKDMSSTFSGFVAIPESKAGTITVDVTGWDTSNVTDMSSMFLYSGSETMAKISFVGMSDWNVSNVTNMEAMFMSGYYMFPSFGDLSDWNTSKVTNMSHMFFSYQEYQSTYKSMGITNWDTSSVTDMSYMFHLNYFDGTVDISGWDTSNVTNMSSMFENIIIENNVNIDLSGWDVSKVTNYDKFYTPWGSGGTITPPAWKFAYFSVYSDYDKSLSLYYSSTGVLPSKGETYNNKVVTEVNNLILDGKPISCSTVVPTQIIVEDNIVALNSMSSWFSGCTKVNKIDVSKLDTSNVTDMSNVFSSVGSDASVTSMTITGINDFNTTKVTTMSGMFYDFGKNASYTLDLSEWDVSNISRWGYSNFNYGVTTKVIAPIWPTTT